LRKGATVLPEVATAVSARSRGAPNRWSAVRRRWPRPDDPLNPGRGRSNYKRKPF